MTEKASNDYSWVGRILLCSPRNQNLRKMEFHASTHRPVQTRPILKFTTITAIFCLNLKPGDFLAFLNDLLSFIEWTSLFIMWEDKYNYAGIHQLWSVDFKYITTEVTTNELLDYCQFV